MTDVVNTDGPLGREAGAARVPADFVAGRPINLLGTVYAQGASIPASVVAQVRNASALLNRRWIVAGVGTAVGTLRGRPRPTPQDLPASMRRGL